MKKLIAAKRIQPLNDIQDRVYLIIFSLYLGKLQLREKLNADQAKKIFSIYCITVYSLRKASFYQ